MAKMTIAQLREKELITLANYGDGNIDDARRIMNSFYRLCGLCERLLYLENDERWHDKPHTKRLEEQQERWIKRLDNELSAKYNLRLFFCGYMPSIGTIDERNCVSEKITRWFYQ